MGGDCRRTDGLSVRRRREIWRWEQLETRDGTDGEEKEEVGDPAMESAAGGRKRTGKTKERLEAGRCGAGGQRSADGRLE
ncbi:hypothetical protein ACLOJK_023448 [Asimina triloba]